jgi:asparagine synthase (glutamine-hydrolysing)
VKVVLTGEGSDELLAGYARYLKTVYNIALGRLYQRSVPATGRRMIREALDRSLCLRPRKLSRTFLALEPDITSTYLDNFAVFPRAMQRRLFTPGSQERIGKDAYAGILPHIDRPDCRSLLDKLLAADLKTYLHELLMKQDQMSMAASIESRVPFLDHELVEFSAGLPVRMKLRGLTTKYILRRAMKSRLPAQILSRRKMGFPVPIGRWLRGPFSRLLDEYLLSERSRERGIFNHLFVTELVVRHRAGEDHSERLWSLMNFEIWQRRFFDGEASGAPPCVSEKAVMSMAV